MSDSLEACTVELIDGVDITKLPLAPVEGFILSRIERRVAVAEVGTLTGLPPAQLAEALHKLAGLGAVRIFDANGTPRAAKSPASTRPQARRRSGSSGRHRPVGESRRPLMAESSISSSPPLKASGSQRAPRSHTPSSAGPSVSETPAHPAQPPAAPSRFRAEPPPSARKPSAESGTHRASSPPTPSYDPSLLEEEVDLPLERRKQVLELEARLATCTHYEALGVKSDASRKEIRTAYFALSKAFHPDTMFRRQLGSYKMRMEVVFKGITEAYDTLSKKNSRADYDAYLEATQATRKSERRLRESVELEGIVVEEAVSGATATPSASASSNPSPSQPSERAKELKRQAMAARIGRTIAAVRATAPPPTAGSEPAPEDRRERLQSLAQSLRQSGQGSTVDSHVRQARQSEQAGDIAGAQDHLRRAISIAPARDDLQAEHTRLSARLAEQLAHDYAQQAELEEKNGKWAEAALSWSKVFGGQPANADAARRAAGAMVRAGGDLRRAHHFARQAVLLSPRDVQNRIMLGQIMMQIGLAKGARRELQTALGLDPRNEMVKNLLAELQG